MNEGPRGECVSPVKVIQSLRPPSLGNPEVRSNTNGGGGGERMETGTGVGSLGEGVCVVCLSLVTQGKHYNAIVVL